jgi:hypothetical protein
MSTAPLLRLMKVIGTGVAQHKPAVQEGLSKAL